MSYARNENGLYTEPLTVTACEDGFVVEGPHGVNVAMTAEAVRESARRLTAALASAEGGASRPGLD